MFGPQEQAIRRSFDSFFNPCAPLKEHARLITVGLPFDIEMTHEQNVGDGLILAPSSMKQN